MKIDPGIQRTKAQDQKKTTQIDTDKETTEAKAPSSPKLKADKVTISEQARSLQRVDTDLVSGNLITDEVVERTAEAILKSGTLSDLINIEQPLIKAMLAETGDLEASEEKLALIKEKIQSGYYNSPEVAENIAEQLIDDWLE